eukprot:CAMPEP_0173283394 /NCGR_PEP_ID=MMETSP1143-20121109/7390_1 /TAXON_ID=483371 /ORGANISM="non described non described, Strain CCMP2298" /LENGTH=272 /DNA_ID=CAMNT_0014221149 /DNA_START=289 /DNA_END=1107 /DNA_ORIENTATION=+
MPRRSVVALLLALVLTALTGVRADDVRAHVQAHEIEDAPAIQAKPLLRRAHVQDSPPRARKFNWGPGAESPTATPTRWTDPTAAPSPLTAAPTHHRHHTRNPTWTTPTAAPTPIDVVAVGTFSTLSFGSASFSGSGTVFPAGLSFSLSGNVLPTDLSFSGRFSSAPPGVDGFGETPTAAPPHRTVNPTCTTPTTPFVTVPAAGAFSTLAAFSTSTPAGFSTKAFSFDYSTSQPAGAFSTAAFSAFSLSSSSSVKIGGGDAFGSADPIAAEPI